MKIGNVNENHTIVEYRLSDEKNQQFLHNIFEKSARDFYNDEVAPHIKNYTE